MKEDEKSSFILLKTNSRKIEKMKKLSLYLMQLIKHPKIRGEIRQSPVKDMGFCGRVFLLKLK